MDSPKCRGVATGFLAEVGRAEDLIAQFPESAPEILPGIRKRVLRKFPYSLIYTIERDEPRRIGSWLLRRSELGTRMALRLGSREPFTWGGLVRRVYRRLHAARQSGALAGYFGTLRRPLHDLSSDKSRL